MTKFDEDQVKILIKQGKDKEARKVLKEMINYTTCYGNFYDYCTSRQMMIELHDKTKQHVESLVVFTKIRSYYPHDSLWNHDVDVCVGNLKNYLFKRNLIRW